MKKILLAVTIAALTCAGCTRAILPSGITVSEVRDAVGFEGISVADGLRVTVDTGAARESVEVEADDNLMEYIETFVSDGTLFIKIRDGITIKGHASITVTVNAISMEALAASGGSVVACRAGSESPQFAAALSGGSRLEGDFRVETAAVTMSGGSRMEGSLHAETVALSMSGGSRAALTGAADLLVLNCSGGSVAGGFGLSTDEAVLTLSGGSKVNLTVDRSIIVRASGGSTLAYRGEAVVKERSLSGGSTVARQ